jgi:opacity protein-like surface antigen
MMMSRSKLVAALAALALLVGTAGLAQAEGTGLHMGASAAWALYDFSGDLDDDNFDTVDEDDLGWELFVGYRFNKIVALELGYVDFGEIEGKSSTTGGAGGASSESQEVDVTADAKGVFTRVVGYLPLIDNCLDLTGSAGALFYDNDVRSTIGLLSESEGNSGVAPTVGVGILWRVHDSILIGAGYERYFGIDDIDIDSLKATIIFEDW